MARALALGARGREFKSHLPDIENLYAPVAQMDRAPAFHRSLYGELKLIECMWLYARKSLIFLRIICRQPLNYR